MYDLNSPDYWNQKYINNDTEWDLKSPLPEFKKLILENKLISPCRLLTIGCGKCYDAVFAASQGYDVTAIDFSDEALKIAGEVAKKENVNIKFVRNDLFKLKDDFSEKFDAVFEYTTFCAIHPDRRKELAENIAHVLDKNGKFYSVLFPIDGREGGPPFSINIIEFYQIMRNYFEVEFFSRIIDSVKPRMGKEALFIYSLKK